MIAGPVSDCEPKAKDGLFVVSVDEPGQVSSVSVLVEGCGLYEIMGIQ